MKPFDLEAAKRGDPVQTVNKKPVRLICFDRKTNSEWVIIGLFQGVYLGENIEQIEYFNKHGNCYHRVEFNLVMAPKKRVFWVNVYSDDNIIVGYESEKAADDYCGIGRIGPARRIEIEE